MSEALSEKTTQGEVNSLEEVRRYNDQQIAAALHHLVPPYVSALSSTLQKKSVAGAHAEEALCLRDRDGQELKCYISLHVIAMHPVDKERKYSATISIHSSPESDELLTTFSEDVLSLSWRSWMLRMLDNNPTIQIISESETDESFKGLGLGRALLLYGESFIEQVAIKLSLPAHTEILFKIEDGSNDGWTSRVISLLPGYQQVVYDSTVFTRRLQLK